MKDRRPWLKQEDDAIIQLVKKYGTKRWKKISQDLIEVYELESRSGKQCRQRYHNHLDNQINKKPWTKEQENIILNQHKKYGNKWSEIARHLQGRTDNSIKNRFYSFLRKSLRRINKVIGTKNSTISVRDIKPSVLSKILEFADKDENTEMLEQQVKSIRICKFIRQTLYQFSNFKPLKKQSSQQKMLEQNQKKFREIIQFIKQLNDQYEKSKIDQEKKKQKNKTDPENLIQQIQYNMQLEISQLEVINIQVADSIPKNYNQMRLTRSQIKKKLNFEDLDKTKKMDQEIKKEQKKSQKNLICIQEDDLRPKNLADSSILQNKFLVQVNEFRQQDNISIKCLKSVQMQSSHPQNFYLQPLYDLKDIFCDDNSEMKLDTKSIEQQSTYNYFTHTPIHHSYKNIYPLTPMTPITKPYLDIENQINFSEENLNKKLLNLKNSVNDSIKMIQNPKIIKQQIGKRNRKSQ